MRRTPSAMGGIDLLTEDSSSPNLHASLNNSGARISDKNLDFVSSVLENPNSQKREGSIIDY